MNPARSINVLVATPLGPGGQGGIDRMMDSAAAEFAARPRPGCSVTFRPCRGTGSILLAPLVLARFCAEMVARRLAGRLDLVHINLSAAGSTYRKLVVAGLARLIGVPYVVHLHSGRYPGFWAHSPSLLRRLVARMFNGSSRIVVLGRVWADFIVREWPSTSNRIAVIPNAAPAPADIAEREGPLRIVFLGRLGPKKGTPELVGALASLPDAPAWGAVLAGDGAVGETRQEIADLGLAASVDVPGWLGPEAVSDLLAGADILVLPSHEENLPMVVIEAMAAGTAVIATPVGAVEEIVRDGETGLIVPVGDEKALAGALKRLLADDVLRERLARSARAFHQAELDIGRYADRLAALWRDALAGADR